MHHRIRSITLALAPLAIAAGVAGCASSEQQRRTAREAPADLRPQHLIIAAYPLLDYDNNGYPDTIPIVVYLWDDRHPLPVWADGSMRFTLADENNEVIAEWAVPADVVRASRRRDQVGATHQMTLDIREATTDVRPVANAKLSGYFVSDDGEEGHRSRPLGIQIGS